MRRLYSEWGGDPVTSKIIIAGNNAVATDATAARFMGVDPEAGRGTPPFIRADNHIRLCAEVGLGSVSEDEIDIIGEMPVNRAPYSVRGGAEPDIFSTMEKNRKRVSRSAVHFFEHRDRYVNQHAGEAICLLDEEVLFSAPVDEDYAKQLGAIAKGQGLNLADMFYGMFCKLVVPEEAELDLPYRAEISQ
ncbi:MAG: hypothetical protein CMN78_01510 [Spirochaetales bacterium]|nr:hypothetical protein [Spirochaetales bacterium]